MEGGAVRHNVERDPPRDHSCQVRFNLVQRFQRRRFKCESLQCTTDNGHQVMAKPHLAFGQVMAKAHMAFGQVS